MKILSMVFSVSCVVVIGATQLFADVTPVKPANKKTVRLTPEKRQAMQMKRFGGWVLDTRNQRGSISVVNAQKTADVAMFTPVLDELRRSMKIKFEVKEGEFNLAKPEKKSEACVFVVDDPGLPMSLVAPESGWVMVNVASLKTGAGAKPQFYKARVQKLLMRGLSYLMGAANSAYPMNIVGCVTKPEDLDQYPSYRLPVDVLGKFEPYVAGYGITPYRRSTYKQAVVEGWAPNPTNQFQKAIWEEVHTLPTAPIEIKPETKR